MSDSMVIKDLKEAYYMHSGLAFSADETYDLWAEFDARDRRIAELEAENAGLKERVAMLDVTAVFKSLGEMGYIEQTNKLHARIAELEAEVEELKPYRDGYDPENEFPPEGEWVLLRDCDDQFEPVQYDRKMDWYWNYEGCWMPDNGDIRRWYPIGKLPEVQE